MLRITTEDGAVGEAYHEWSGPMLADIVDRILRDELVGERADRREWLWHRLWELDRTEEFPIWLFGIVDVALWDLEGRVFGVPVHRLLGTYRDSIPATAPRRRPSRLSRSSSTSATSASSSGTRRSSCTRGATLGRTPICASASARTSGLTST